MAPRTRNTIFFPKPEGPLFYRKATVATYEVDWFLSKGAFPTAEEAAAEGVKRMAELNRTPETQSEGQE